jgi:hypothetical protein
VPLAPELTIALCSTASTVPYCSCLRYASIASPPNSRFKVHPRETWDLRRQTEIIPVKDSHTRTKPLALVSGYGRHIHNRYTRTGTFFRWGMAVTVTGTYGRNKFVAVSLPKRLRNGRFRSEMVTWIQKWFKISAGTSRKLYIYIIL